MMSESDMVIQEKNMKYLIKKLIPKKLFPYFQQAYQALFVRQPKADFSQEQYERLPALKCCIAYNKYGGYCVPLSVTYGPVARRILSNDVYEPQTIEFMTAHCGNGDIVHAGTFFGDFLPALSRSINPNAKIWAFEPNPENYRCTKITLEINGIENVVLENAGLGANSEKLLLQTTDKTGQSLGGASRIVSEEANTVVTKERVDVIRLDDIVPKERRVTVIHLDIEGYELKALMGALATIRRCLPIIIIEVLPNSSISKNHWFIENILSVGYQKVGQLYENQAFYINKL